jgi:hypothetical protein
MMFLGFEVYHWGKAVSILVKILLHVIFLLAYKGYLLIYEDCNYCILKILRLQIEIDF